MVHQNKAAATVQKDKLVSPPQRTNKIRHFDAISNPPYQQQEQHSSSSSFHPSRNSSSNNNNHLHNNRPSKILLLHGNRQTGELLLGRIERFRKKLYQKLNIEIVSIDAPFLVTVENNPVVTEENPTTGSNDTPTCTKTWWRRRSSSASAITTDQNNNDYYVGLEESIALVQSTWRSSISTSMSSQVESPFVGLIGFSQGARFVHLLSMIHHEQQQQQQQQTSDLDFLPGLQFVMMVAGYDAPLPPNLYSFRTNNTNHGVAPNEAAPSSSKCTIPNLHIWGERDQLVLPQQSSDVGTNHYHEPSRHIHDGGHHVPMRAADVQVYLDFIAKSYVPSKNNDIIHNNNRYIPNDTAVPKAVEPTLEGHCTPDEECAMQQQDEVCALEAIYGNDFHLLSRCFPVNEDMKYEYPITFRIDIYPTDDEVYIGTSWPSSTISIHVIYPPTYPNIAPILSVVQSTNGVPLPSHEVQNGADCIHAMYDATSNEIGMPCIMTCLIAAKEYFDAPSSLSQNASIEDPIHQQVDTVDENDLEETNPVDNETQDRIHDYDDSTIKRASTVRIQECNLQGLEIAKKLMKHMLSSSTSGCGSYDINKLANKNGNSDNDESTQCMMGKGGSWMFNIGLVGKPSAGKSTFFNIATGFARQRQTSLDGTGGCEKSNDDTSMQQQQQQQQLGGAAMAPHPFTTINPNVGYCLVPAPPGSCPEDSITASKKGDFNVGSTHGRDSEGRRLLPVVLKDVAGLVPGAYQGRGRGNQFLNDLCDADVLIHVCDASGIADSEGNIILTNHIENTNDASTKANNENGNSSTSNEGSDPLEDMAWIRNELIEWVYTNLLRKWDTIRRKGRSKLEGMFSGYGQSLAMTRNLLNAVEKHMIYQVDNDHHQRFVHPYDEMGEWDTGDIYRLVSAFLGVRFPIALALNKMDIQSSRIHIEKIIAALPVHGTHVATSLSAKCEMLFTKHHMEATLRGTTLDGVGIHETKMSTPLGTWNCLQSAICLCDPILVFPVMDHQSYLPLPGLFRYATSDPSLPSRGMITCIHAAGGIVPSEYDSTLLQYSVPKVNGNRKKAVTTQSNVNQQLRDAIMMKPGSTINDLFHTLKTMGALNGEFIRAEACCNLFDVPKPVTKYQLLSKQIRIIKIMTNKRSVWQSTTGTVKIKA